MQLNVTIKGTPEALAKLAKLGAKLRNFQPELTEVGKYLKGYYSGESFLSQGGVFNQRWEPLKDATKIQKMKKYPGKGPLERTGDMRNAFTYSALPTSLMVENTDPKFPYHQSSEPRTRLPRRVMIGVNDTIKTYVNGVVRQGVVRIISSNGL